MAVPVPRRRCFREVLEGLGGRAGGQLDLGGEGVQARDVGGSGVAGARGLARGDAARGAEAAGGGALARGGRGGFRDSGGGGRALVGVLRGAQAGRLVLDEGDDAAVGARALLRLVELEAAG